MAGNKTVALLTANPALTSILSAVLATEPGLRVRSFEARTPLNAYMRIAPVDLLVSDFDNVLDRADALARHLRHDGLLVRRDFQVIALARSIGEDTRIHCTRAGIDEVIVKPMSPKYLVERVRARLRRPSGYRRHAGAYFGPERRSRIALAPPGTDLARRAEDNVVPFVPKTP